MTERQQGVLSKRVHRNSNVFCIRVQIKTAMCFIYKAMAGPIFETFQGFLSGHMFVQAGNMRACRPQAKCCDAQLM